MRRLTIFILTLTLITAPITSMIATAIGFSGEHVHYDQTSHAAADWAQATFKSRSAHSHGHDHETGAHPGGFEVVAHDDGEENRHDDDGGAPLKHSHADQVHAAPFIAVAAPLLAMPDLMATTASASASFPLQRQPHPPFRPPQGRVSA